MSLFFPRCVQLPVTVIRSPRRCRSEYMYKYTKRSSSLTGLTIRDGVGTGHIKATEGWGARARDRGYTCKWAERILIGIGSCWRPHSSRNPAGNLPDVEIFGHFAGLELEKQAGRGKASTHSWGQMLELIKTHDKPDTRTFHLCSFTGFHCLNVLPLKKKNKTERKENQYKLIFKRNQ